MSDYSLVENQTGDATTRWKAKSAAQWDSALSEYRHRWIICAICVFIIVSLLTILIVFSVRYPKYCSVGDSDAGLALRDSDNTHISCEIRPGALIGIIYSSIFLGIILLCALFSVVEALQTGWTSSSILDFRKPLVALEACEEIRHDAALLSWNFVKISSWVDNGIISGDHKEVIARLKTDFSNNQRDLNAFIIKYPRTMANSTKVQPYFHELRQKQANLEEDYARLHAIIVDDLPDPEIWPEDIMDSKV